MGGGPRVAYPKHVWSPAGGWYAQPRNWQKNTVVAGAAVASIVAMVFYISSGLETRHHMPEQGRFFPTRYFNKQIRAHDAKQRELNAVGAQSESSSSS